MFLLKLKWFSGACEYVTHLLERLQLHTQVNSTLLQAGESPPCGDVGFHVGPMYTASASLSRCQSRWDPAGGINRYLYVIKYYRKFHFRGAYR